MGRLRPQSHDPEPAITTLIPRLASAWTRVSASRAQTLVIAALLATTASACGSSQAAQCPACPATNWSADAPAEPACPVPDEPRKPPAALTDAPVWNQAPRAQTVELIGFSERGYAIFRVGDDAIGAHLLARHPDEDPILVLIDDNERRATKKLARKAGDITLGTSQRRADGVNVFALDEAGGAAIYLGCGDVSQRYLAVELGDSETALTPRAIAWSPDGERIVWVYRVTRDGEQAADRFGGIAVKRQRMRALRDCK